jgi:hypothetical protein
MATSGLATRDAQWWDDVHNESFATWMSDRTLAEWKRMEHRRARRGEVERRERRLPRLGAQIRQEIAVDDIVNVDRFIPEGARS